SAVAPGGGTPSGTVTFLDGTATLATATLDGTGKAATTTAALAVGPHTLTVSYAGDANFQSNTSTAVTQTVNKTATSAALTSSVGSPVAGQPLTLNASVAVVSPGAGVPTGSVTFADGGTTIGTAPLDGTGHAAFTTSLGAGGHSLTASYA